MTRRAIIIAACLATAACGGDIPFRQTNEAEQDPATVPIKIRSGRGWTVTVSSLRRGDTGDGYRIEYIATPRKDAASYAQMTCVGYDAKGNPMAQGSNNWFHTDDMPLAEGGHIDLDAIRSVDFTRIECGISR